MKPATLSEVAKKAGVGTTTVSRVINGAPNVDPKTRARVEAAIELLGYLPNQAARILKGDRTRIIGLVVPSIADPFFASIAEAVQATVHANDSVLIVLATQNEEQTEQEAITVLMRYRVEGIILAPANSESETLRSLLRRLHVPVVALDRPLVGSSIPHVTADNRHGACMATQHLIEHGYRRILCLTGEVGLYTIRERIRGYESAMKKAKLPIMVDTSMTGHQASERIFERYLASKTAPDAIFTLKNSVTIDTFETLQEHGASIPGSVALLGYDDFSLAGTVRPSISVVAQPVVTLGRRAAELLFQRLLHPEMDDAPSVQLRTTLIRRASCGCQPPGS